MGGYWEQPHTSSAPTFGREEILDEANRMLARAREGHGQGLLLVGAGGVGKTQALRAVVDRGIEREFRILTGHGLPKELPAPFSLVRGLLESSSEVATWVPPPFSLVRDLLESRGQVARWESADADRWIPLPIPLAPVGEGAATRPWPPNAPSRSAAPEGDLDRILSPLGLSSYVDPSFPRDHLLGQVEEHFRALARDRPLLLAIDDLHLADTSSLEFLRRFSFELPEISVVVVATVGEAAEIPERTRAPLDSLQRSPTFHSLPLRALTVTEVTEFARWLMGGKSPDPNDVLRWQAQTGGNPLFIEQLVRAVSGYGSVVGQPSSDQVRDVSGILAERVRALGENDRLVLTYASVLGPEFDFVCLRSMVELPEDPLAEIVDRLVRGGILRERRGEVYEFSSEAFRATLYSGLTEARRQVLHQKAGLALEAKGGVEDSELARQFYLGGDNARAVKYNLAAAQNATRVYAFDVGVTYIGRALEAQRRRPDRDPGVEMRFLTEEGRLLTGVGDVPRSEEVFREAVALARSHPGHDLELGRALLGLALSRYLGGDYPKAEVLANEALTYLTTAGTLRDRMAAHRVLGMAYLRQGDLRKAEAHRRAALEIAEREGTPLEQGHALIDVANLIVPSGPARFETALELYARAAKLLAEGGDYGVQARVLINHAVLEWAAGRTDEALKDLEPAIKAAERSYSRRLIGICHLNLAQLQVELGHLDLARPALERAVRVFAPLDNELAEQQILMTRGLIAQAERAFDTAESNYQESLKMARGLHLPAQTAEVLLHLAQLSHDRGDDAAARDRLAQAKGSGLLTHHPYLAPRVETLERSLVP